jgi:hypothetical protein
MRRELYWCDSCGSVLDAANPRYLLTIKEANGVNVHRDLCGDCYTRIMQTYFPERSNPDEHNSEPHPGA